MLGVYDGNDSKVLGRRNEVGIKILQLLSSGERIQKVWSCRLGMYMHYTITVMVFVPLITTRPATEPLEASRNYTNALLLFFGWSTPRANTGGMMNC